jgi:rRNA processing protein Gar1
MSVNVITREVKARTITIKLVDGSIIHGKVNLHRNDVAIGRVSDLFTKVDEPFIVLFDAEAEGEVGKVIILNKINIIWVSPEEGPSQSDKPLQDQEQPKESPKGSLLDRLRYSQAP